jgi:hypothetical protein
VCECSLRVFENVPPIDELLVSDNYGHQHHFLVIKEVLQLPLSYNKTSTLQTHSNSYSQIHNNKIDQHNLQPSRFIPSDFTMMFFHAFILTILMFFGLTLAAPAAVANGTVLILDAAGSSGFPVLDQYRTLDW